MNKLNHIAFIMDGNGRWAKKQNKLRIFGHSNGIKVMPPIIEECIKHNIKYISFYAFSTENWNRPKPEVEFLLKLLSDNLTDKNLDWFNKHQIKLNIIGFKENISDKLYKKIKEFENKLNHNNKTIVNIFFNYGSRDEILYAIKQLINKNLEVNIKNFEDQLLTSNIDDVDLLIRTSGENRISNFMLWQIAYSEIIFEPTLWPDYNIEVLNKNILEYHKRIRRFGGINEK